MSIPVSIKNHVHILSSSIFSATFLGKLNKKLVHDTLDTANASGLLPKVREWYLNSQQFNQDLDQLILGLYKSGEDKHVKYLLQSGDSYETTYLGDVGTGDVQYKHITCYRLASQLHDSVVLSPDYMKTYCHLSEAAGNCDIQQTLDVFKAYFGDIKRENISENKDLTVWISTNFSGEQATALNNIINNEQTTYSCNNNDIVTEEISKNPSAGDEKNETTAKETINGGSARKFIKRDEFQKNNTPQYQAYDTSSTLYTTLMMSDLSEITKDTHKHTLLNCMLRQFDTSCDSITKIADLLTGNITQTEDKAFTEKDSIKLYNRFMLNQIGNRGLTSDNNDKAITRDKPDETSTD